MSYACSVFGCKNTKYSKKVVNGSLLRYFVIPKVRQKLSNADRAEARQALWLKRIGRPDITQEDVQSGKKNYYVCGEHFVGGSPANCHDLQNVDWAPSLNLPPSTTQQVLSPSVNGCQTPSAQQPPVPLFSPEHQEWVDKSGNERGVCDEMDVSLLDSSSSVMDLSGFDVLYDSVCDLEENASVDRGHPVLPSSSDVPETPPKSDTSVDFASSAEKLAYEKLQAEYAKSTSSVRKLRDGLTDAEVDRLELEAKLKKAEDEKKAAVEKQNKFEEALRKEVRARIAAERECTALNKRFAKYANDTHRLSAMVKKSEELIFFNLDAFKSNDKKVKFYTGLPNYAVFQWVLDRCTKYMRNHSRHILLPWQRLLLTLMRLRLSLLLEDLGYRFGVSVTTAGDIFNTWLDIVYMLVCPLLISWPSREVLAKVTPREFRENYGSSVVCIIDCFELFCDKPSSLEPRSITFSSYKHHNTVKVLIGISPTGCISFVSTCWGGRTSDQHLVRESGIYELLLPYDVLMADRGFKIAEDVALRGAKLLIPAFTRGSTQLSSVDVGLTRKIAHLRVHVERVIGLVRNKYRFLKSVLPVDILQPKKNDSERLASIDKIVRVCCALTNLSPSVVYRGTVNDDSEAMEEEDDNEDDLL